MLQVDWCCLELPSIVLSVHASSVLLFLAAALALTMLVVSVAYQILFSVVAVSTIQPAVVSVNKRISSLTISSIYKLTSGFFLLAFDTVITPNQ